MRSSSEAMASKAGESRRVKGSGRGGGNRRSNEGMRGKSQGRLGTGWFRDLGFLRLVIGRIGPG